MWGIIQKKDTHTLDLAVARPLGLKELTSLIFRFAKSLLAKDVLMTVQRDFGLGNSPYRLDTIWKIPYIESLCQCSDLRKHAI
jgi:hypothetical protein